MALTSRCEVASVAVCCATCGKLTGAEINKKHTVYSACSSAQLSLCSGLRDKPSSRQLSRPAMKSMVKLKDCNDNIHR